MSCTADEIALKKKIALERLNAKRHQNITSPNLKTQQSSELIPSKSTDVFYGSNKNRDILHDNNKIQSKPTNNSRILSQPYPKQTPSEDFVSSPNVKGKDNQQKKLAPVFSKTITCTCSLVSVDRFVVKPSGYHAVMIDIFKTIPSKKYDPATKLWTFHLNDYSLVQEKISLLNPDVVIGSIPSYILNLFNARKNSMDYSFLSSINTNLVDTLMQFQKEGVRFAIEKQGRCMIADEMGLGKTYQALAVADFYKDDWPLLICTTASTRDVWATKIRSLLPYVACHNIVVLTSNQDYIGDSKILISSYSLMEKNLKKMMDKKFGFLILDESHSLKNHKAKCTVSALALAKKAKRVILLTGTPALSRPCELFTQLQMCDKNFFSFMEYTARYCEGKQTNFGWDASGQSNLTELNILLKRKFMVRRVKSDVLCDLAQKARETIVLDPSLIWTNKDVEHNMLSFASKYLSSKGSKKEEVLLKYYNETGFAKKDAVCAYIKELLIKEKMKILVFAHHLVMLDAISDCLQKLKIEFIRIDGSTKPDLRTEYVKHFQNEKSCRVAVLSLKACNAGITLTAAQLVVFAELDWNPSTLSQAESRAHRIGQEGNVTIKYLMAQGTADDVIWEMLKNKQQILKKAGLNNEDFSNATLSAAPFFGGNIEKFFVRKGNEQSSNSIDDSIIVNKVNDNTDKLIASVLEEHYKEEEQKKNKKLNEENELQKLLDDDGDDVLAGLQF